MSASEDNRMLPQYFAVAALAFAAVSSGNSLGWTSPTLPQLQTHNSSRYVIINHKVTAGIQALGVSLLVTSNEASWIGSLLPLGATFGALPAGVVAQSVGRKTTLQGVGILFLLCWSLIFALPANLMALYVARAVAGVAAGALSVIMPLYVQEIVSTHVRGRTGVVFDLSINVGILQAYSMGAWLPHPWLAASLAVAPTIFLLASLFVPESPANLVRRGRTRDAEAALRWLRVKDVSATLRELEEAPQDAGGACVGYGKAVAIVFGLMTFRPLSGINMFTFYTVKIFQEAGGYLSPSASTIVVGCILVCSNFVSSRLVDVLGRRFLLSVSQFGMLYAYVILGTFYVFRTVVPEAGDSVAWMPLTGVVVFEVSFSLGMGPLPWLIMAELLPPGVRSWASGASVALTWSIAFFVTRFCADLTERLGHAITYFGFAAVAAAALAFVLTAVPETKGKTPEEIRKSVA